MMRIGRPFWKQVHELIRRIVFTHPLVRSPSPRISSNPGNKPRVSFSPGFEVAEPVSYGSSPSIGSVTSGAATKSSKWQPLSAASSNTGSSGVSGGTGSGNTAAGQAGSGPGNAGTTSAADANSQDPFSLGDSDEETEARPKTSADAAVASSTAPGGTPGLKPPIVENE